MKSPALKGMPPEPTGEQLLKSAPDDDAELERWVDGLDEAQATALLEAIDRASDQIPEYARAWLAATTFTYKAGSSRSRRRGVSSRSLRRSRRASSASRCAGALRKLIVRDPITAWTGRARIAPRR